MGDSNKNSSGFVSAIFGAVLGAGAVLLADPKNRKKLKAKMNEMWSDVEDKVEETKKLGRQKITAEINKTKARLSDKLKDES
jgi:gas vesicle protein